MTHAPQSRAHVFLSSMFVTGNIRLIEPLKPQLLPTAKKPRTCHDDRTNFEKPHTLKTAARDNHTLSASPATTHKEETGKRGRGKQGSRQTRSPPPPEKKPKCFMLRSCSSGRGRTWRRSRFLLDPVKVCRQTARDVRENYLHTNRKRKNR